MKEITKISNILSNADKTALLDLFYPVGTFYKTADDNFDPNTAWGGTWELLDKDQVLWSVGSDAKGGTSFSQQLPNSKGSFVVPRRKSSTSASATYDVITNPEGNISVEDTDSDSALQYVAGSSAKRQKVTIKLSDGNSVYKDNGKVRPKGIGAHIWQRVA